MGGAYHGALTAQGGLSLAHGTCTHVRYLWHYVCDMRA